jgi:hypothetical protein
VPLLLVLNIPGLSWILVPLNSVIPMKPEKDGLLIASWYPSLEASIPEVGGASSLELASVLPPALRMLLSTWSPAPAFVLAGFPKSSSVHTSESMLRRRCLLAVFLGEYECEDVGDADFEGGNSSLEWLGPQLAKMELVRWV